MNKFLGIFFGVIFAAQFANAGSYGKEASADMGDHKETAATVEKVMEESPTAAGMEATKDDGEAMADQATEAMDEMDVDEAAEKPMEEASEY